MTDNDIIQALEQCGTFNCDSCPLRDYGDNSTICSGYLYGETIDLINRQKAEIEKLKSMNQSKLDTIHDLQAEIERLKEERDMAVKDIYCSTKCFICKNMPSDGNMTHCPNYSSCGLAYINFKWRGENNGNV